MGTSGARSLRPPRRSTDRLAAASLLLVVAVTAVWSVGARVVAWAVLPDVSVPMAPAAPTTAAASSAPVAPTAEVVMADTEATVSELVAVVRRAAAQVPGAEPDGDLRIVFTDVIDGSADHFVGGWQAGDTVWVRIVGTAMPTRSLLHELAHATTPGDEHGERFRAVYLAAVAEVYGVSVAAREERRLSWVYDRCYLDDSCPVVAVDARGD